jgi:dehydro coenzyme F420 reductase / coenzyme F420-0:L-glutamate ligase / coenzyme F420-1:gamma-L-glutamate ligase
VTGRIEIWGIDGLPEVVAGDDLAGLIATASPDLRDGDVVVVTSKIVSKAEGRLVAGAREDHLAAETARVVAQRGTTQIVETHHGLVLAAAGIDGSNVPAGTVALLPLDSDASAARIRAGLQQRRGADVAVIVSDTMGRPWRDGLIDTAIGAAGLDVLWDLRGERDTAGRLLEATVIAVADELASAADLVKGKLAATPVAIIRGFPLRRHDPDLGARPLIRPAADDMFRLGSREAQRQVVLNSAPLRESEASKAGVDTLLPRIQRAVDALGPVGVTLSVDDHGDTVTAIGDPLTVGIVVGRLLAALAAEDLRAWIATPPSDPETTAVLHVLAPNDAPSLRPHP